MLQKAYTTDVNIPKAQPSRVEVYTCVPNNSMIMGTENVVTHALPNLSEEKEEEKRGSLLFSS